MASSAIHNGEEALNILQKSINKMMKMECLPFMDESIKSKLGSQFDNAFNELNEKIIL
jgi:superfamily II DNA or RNA helicase